MNLLSFQRRRGQSLVEFAFVLSAFMILAMAVVDLGRGILYYNMLSNAVREGARFGIISSHSAADICTVVENAMQAPGTQGCGDSTKDLDVDVTQGCDPGDAYIDSSKETGTAVVVIAHYNFTLITPLIGAITGNSITLTAKSEMYNEDWGTPTGVAVGGCP